MSTAENPFRYFNSSPEVIRLAVLMYVRFPLSLRNVEDLLFERGIDLSYETVRYWWNRFGPMFAAENRRVLGTSERQGPWLTVPEALEALDKLPDEVGEEDRERMASYRCVDLQHLRRFGAVGTRQSQAENVGWAGSGSGSRSRRWAPEETDRGQGRHGKGVARRWPADGKGGSS